MAPMLIGTKLGMTRVFDDTGASIPVTVIEISTCVVTQVRDEDKDGYSAVQVFLQLISRDRTLRRLFLVLCVARGCQSV